MKLETFSYLPSLTQEQVAKQIQYILDNGLIPSIEYTAKPELRDDYWSMWKLPLFDVKSVQEVLDEIEACKAANPGCYIKLNGYEPIKRQEQQFSFVVHRPGETVGGG